MGIHPALSRVTINYSPPPTVHYFDEPPAPTPAVKIIHHETRLPVHQKLNLGVDGALGAGKELGVGEARRHAVSLEYDVTMVVHSHRSRYDAMVDLLCRTPVIPFMSNQRGVAA
jgi:hypothetical protein